MHRMLSRVDEYADIPDILCNCFSIVMICIEQDVLDQVVPILVAGNYLLISTAISPPGL